MGIAFGFLAQDQVLLARQRSTSSTSADCREPVVRKEWRSFSHHEKLHYIEAVQCLAKKPSRIRENGTLYDDFPYVHVRFGAQGWFARYGSSIG